jgi:hypothetical protein
MIQKKKGFDGSFKGWINKSLEGKIKAHVKKTRLDS